MARVVRPDGWVASYMWDAPEGGLPAQPIAAAARALGMEARPAIPGFKFYALSDMQALWERAGLREVENRRIDIQATYADFDDFWESNTLLGTPIAKMVDGLSAEDRNRIRTYLHDTLPRDAAGHITCDAFANAVKGRVPS